MEYKISGTFSQTSTPSGGIRVIPTRIPIAAVIGGHQKQIGSHPAQTLVLQGRDLVQAEPRFERRAVDRQLVTLEDVLAYGPVATQVRALQDAKSGPPNRAGTTEERKRRAVEMASADPLRSDKHK